MEGGRAPSQALTYRTSEADHSFATDNEACAAPKTYSKKTFSGSFSRSGDGGGFYLEVRRSAYSGQTDPGPRPADGRGDPVGNRPAGESLRGGLLPLLRQRPGGGPATTASSPWDDDADIVLFRADFEKLRAYWLAHPVEGYFWQDTRTDPGIILKSPRSARTTPPLSSRRSKALEMHHGLFVDIFRAGRLCAEQIPADADRVHQRCLTITPPAGTSRKGNRRSSTV